jgi:Cu(I)/Ag(I) efflux system membrane fusion protein
MKSSFSAPIVVLAIIVAGGVGLFVGKSNQPGSSAPSAMSVGASVASNDNASGATASEGGSKRIKYYRNPMGLPDKSDTPKKDNMGMAYLPVYEDEDNQDDDSAVKVSAGKLQKTGVQTEIAERRSLNTMVRAPGTVEEDERRRSVVSLRFEGFIDTVENVTTGTHVHKGEPLMRIYGPNLSSAAAEYLSALNARPDAGIGSQALKGARRRLENLGAPDAFIADLERTREVPAYVSWPAPQDGEIVERTAVNGMRAGPGDVLFRIVDHEVVWVMADIAERDLGLVEVGQKVIVRPRAHPDHPFTGKVTVIYPHLKMETRTARIRIELPNPDDVLLPECRRGNCHRNGSSCCDGVQQRRHRQRGAANRASRQGRRPFRAPGGESRTPRRRPSRDHGRTCRRRQGRGLREFPDRCRKQS